MRKLYFLFLLLTGMLAGFNSCSKQTPGEISAAPDSNVLTATVSANQTYQLTLDNSIRTGILKQASHFQVSQTELDTQSGSMVYKYVPALNYTGTDEVILSIIKPVIEARTGCSSQNTGTTNVTYITSWTTLKINVTGK